MPPDSSPPIDLEKRLTGNLETSEHASYPGNNVHVFDRGPRAWGTFIGGYVYRLPRKMSLD
jgi:hypothetical protein